jgi:Xaa-Pro aminopeptidase
MEATEMRLTCVALLLAPVAAFPQANPWYQTDFPPEEFQARWAKVFDKIGDHAVAILEGVPQTNGFIMPRQSNDFYYLCGIETPHAYLLLDGRDKKPRFISRLATPGSKAPRVKCCPPTMRCW